MTMHIDLYYFLSRHCTAYSTDLYKYSIQMPYLLFTANHIMKPPIRSPPWFRSIFSDNLQPIATRGKKARGTLLVDSGSSIKHAPLSVSYYNKISGGHIWRGLVWRRGSAGPVLLLWPIQSLCSSCHHLQAVTIPTKMAESSVEQY